MRGRHKKWAAPYLDSHPETVFNPVDPKDPFFAEGPLYLEIGIGKGDFIVGMSEKKGGRWLGLERDVSIMGMAAKKVIEGEKKNVRLRAEDFDLVAEEMDGVKFDAIYLNFSDPWPKKRHAKRRLTERMRLQRIASFLKDDGLIIFKSDNVILYEFTLEEVPEAGLKIVSCTDHYDDPVEDDTMTEYERNFRSQGKPITKIIISK